MLRTRSVALATTLALTVVAAMGCGRLYQRPENASMSAPCTGRPYLDVRNSLEQTVELYGYVGVASAPRYLASLPPGTQRVLLVEPVGSYFGQIGGRRVGGQALSVTRGCEASD